MANLEHPEGEAELPPVQHPAGLSASGASRRRFARTGAGASAGVIATLASKSAMASASCMTPSAACSGNQSRVNQNLACAGVSPGFWKTHHEDWPGARINGDAKFSLVFPLTSRCASLSAYSCFDIVDPDKVTNGGDPDNVAMHMMATLLNVRSRRIGFLTEAQVKAIWDSYSFNGTYSPTAGVTWSGEQIVTYLKSTMS